MQKWEVYFIQTDFFLAVKIYIVFLQEKVL